MSRDSTATPEENGGQDIPRNSETVQHNHQDEVNPALDPRKAQLDDIVRRRRDEREGLEEDPDPAEPIAAAEDQDPPPPDEGVDKEPETPWLERDGKRFAKLKVYGEEREVDEDELIRAGQKHYAAEKRMTAIASLEKQLQQREQSLVTRETEINKKLQESQHSKPPNSGASDDVDELINETTEAIYSGDEEKLKKALARLAAGRQQPTQEPEDLDQRVMRAAQQVVAQHTETMTLKDAYSRFKKDYSDVANDPHLRGLADEFALEVEAENPGAEPYQIMKLAGDKVREYLAQKAKAYAPPSGMSDRTQRKRNSMGAVTGANRTASLGKDEPPPRTRSDVIKDMARQRGQQV